MGEGLKRARAAAKASRAGKTAKRQEHSSQMNGWQLCAMRLESLQLAQRIRADNRFGRSANTLDVIPYQAADVVADAQRLLDFIKAE